MIPSSTTREFGNKLVRLKELCNIDRKVLDFKIVNKKNSKIFLEQHILNNTLINLTICDRKLRFRYENRNETTSYLYLTHYNEKYLEMNLEDRDLIMEKQNDLLDRGILNYRAFVSEFTKIDEEIINNSINEEIVEHPVINQKKENRWINLINQIIKAENSMAGNWRRTEFWGHNFEGENFSESDMSLSSYYCCNLSNCNLQNIFAVRTDFSYVDFKNSNLTGANLTDANLTGANLTGANLTDANLADTNLIGTNFTNIIRETPSH